jgi:hypothetical protein
MTLHFATGPENGIALVQQGLSKLHLRADFLATRAIDFRTLQVSQPHAVYDLRADAIAGGAGLTSARLTGFRYLVQGGGGANIAAAEVLANATGTAPILANINYGPFVEATAQALARIQKLAAVNAGSYEVRLLRFSAIALMALWLKPDTGGADMIDPLAPAPAGLRAGQMYSAEDFVKAILPIVQKRIANKNPAMVP